MSQPKRYEVSVTIPLERKLALALMVWAVDERGTSRVAVIREILVGIAKQPGVLNKIYQAFLDMSENEIQKVEQKYLPTSKKGGKL